MPLIKCSECGKEISDQAQACPNCGYQIKSFNYVIHFNWANMKGNTFLKTTIVIDGETVGEMKCGHSMDCAVSEGSHKVELLFRGNLVIQETVIVGSRHPEEYFAYRQAFLGLKRVPANSVKWKSLCHNSDGVLNVPTCPTCGSHKVKKLSMSGKMMGVGVFGLASGSVGKTFMCKNCGYKW